MIRFALLLCSFCPLLAISQNRVDIGSSPAWPAKIEYSAEIPDTAQSGGYYYLLLERQISLQSNETYYRTAVKVLTEKGLETASSISVNYDPAFQKLVFHTVIVKRGNESINKLRTNKFEILRREQNMDRLIYDKSLDAMLNLDDVQVGDIVEFSYSVKGVNPVFANKFSKVLYFNYSDPVGKRYVRIESTKTRKLQFKPFAHAQHPEKTEKGDLVFYTWDLDHVPALLSEDKLPAWYEAYAHVEATEFETWRDLSQWALPLYSTKSILSSPGIDKKIAELKSKHPKLEDQVNACIQFVQDEIRYLSFSDGIQGYKPHSPIQVFNQRFGDCKDKSLLLSYMLQKLGVVCYPALVNTELGKVLNESIPSPTLFDHCIAQVHFADSVYWVDPTYTLQRGSLKFKTTSNYYNALVIADTTRGLTSMDFNSTFSKVKVEEDFSFPIVGGSATLKVKTTYWGEEATSMRNYWKSSNSEEIKKGYTDFYANEYPDIKLDAYVQFTDDEAQNVLTTLENYSIDNFWTYDSLKGQYQADFYARILSNSLDLPTTKTRSMPFRVNYPTVVDQTITIHVPEPWRVTKSRKSISSPGFYYSSSTDYSNKEIRLNYSYQARADHVDSQDTKNHFEKIQSAREDLYFQLTYGDEKKSAADFNTPFLILSLFLAPLVYIGCRKLYLFDPRARDYQMSHDQIGGLLILPALGIFLSPLVNLINIGNVEFFNYDNWRLLTDPTFSEYNPSRGVLVLFQFIFSIAMLGFSILLIFLLVKKRTSFPLLVCILWGTNLLNLLIASFWLNSLGLPTSFDGSGLSPFGAVFAAVVWIPFFIFSDRVKGTFRERLR